MNILFATSEANPFIKTGGLADVAYALPKKLIELNENCKVILPLYKSIKENHIDELDFIKDFHLQKGWQESYVGLFKTENEGVTYYFIDNEYYFDRENIYLNDDNNERFAYFNHAILETLKHIEFNPEIIHFNDWHTGILALLYHSQYKHELENQNIKFLYTIHNLKYQGVFEKETLNDFLKLDDYYFNGPDNIEFYNQINFMKAGIIYSDHITTVSKSYADEITYPFFGEKLHGILKKYKNKLTGIVNGIDYDQFNPKKDPLIDYNYSKENVVDKKKKNKLALQKQLGLKQDANIPLVSIVSRLTPMKGFDLIRHIMDELLQKDIQFILLGTGDKEIEDAFKHFENKYPDKMRSVILFSIDLAQKIYASSDIYLMPSKKEPCGLSQLIALRYGTIPIVREVGGLKDTITPYNKSENIGNGFSFKNFNAHELLFKINEALDLYSNKTKWHQMIQRAMNTDNSWEKSAKKYIELYTNL